ncbi:MAG: DNA polymerase III subunit beta [Bacteroidales bacterium]
MIFTVSSSELLKGLLSMSKVVSSNSKGSVIPILDNILFEIEDQNTLKMTASDSDMTLITLVPLDKVQEDGKIAVPAKLLTDSMKEFPELPLNFTTNKNTKSLKISWFNGELQLPCFDADDFPELPTLNDINLNLDIKAETLLKGINTTLFATAEEELRPVMNGIFFDITPEGTSFVASDSHKLVCYTRTNVIHSEKTSFILPKKPASILRSELAKSDTIINIKYDVNHAYFTFAGKTMVCSLVVGKYPAYRSVIPQNNPNILTINRLQLLNASKRVSICGNPASSQIKFSLSLNKLVISAQDLSYSLSSHEDLDCNYVGSEIEIGFKSQFLVELLSNMDSEEISIALADPTRACLILPKDGLDDDELYSSILMPIRILS